VTKLSTTCTPFGIGWSLDELDLVEAVLDERLKFCRGSEVAVECKTSVTSNDC
jgi:hypothetical protein